MTVVGVRWQVNIGVMVPYSPSRLVALAIIVCLLTPLCVTARVQPTHGFDIFSQEEEIQLGKENAAQVMKQLPILPDSDPVTQYVQRLGARLAEHAPGYKWPYSFHVVNVKEINAFALPGGPIFVNLGTIQAADNEAQLAGVMAHEISHVVQRHGTRAASKQMGAQLPIAILGGILGNGTLAKAAELGIDEIVDGLNLDDLHDYRPGIKAAGEKRVRHPLVDERSTCGWPQRPGTHLPPHPTHVTPASRGPAADVPL